MQGATSGTDERLDIIIALLQQLILLQRGEPKPEPVKKPRR